jgi:TPR repeat protein
VAAQVVLGICYLDGIDVVADDQKAFVLLSIAAERGAARAKANLARMYAEGLGVDKDLPRAAGLYEAAAEAGECQAQLALARLLANGIDGRPDPIGARRWYSAAVAQEDKIQSPVDLDEAKEYLSRP